MSAFLGPVHYWLFSKIVLFENLEENINNNIKEKYGEVAIKLANDIKEKYGEFIPKEPLEKLIDSSNIHGWLQNKISIAETRQAATLKTYIDNFGQDALEIIKQNYINQGMESGKLAAQSVDLSGAPEIYKELNNYILDGMPCDNVNSITISKTDIIEWNSQNCLHKPYWDTVNVDIETMYHLRFSWIKAFVENSNNNFTYKNMQTDEGFLHQIVKL